MALQLTVTGLFLADGGSFVSRAVESLELTLEGIAGVPAFNRPPQGKVPRLNFFV